MEIVIIILLILLNGIFAMSEIALISARRSNLELRARQGNAMGLDALALFKNYKMAVFLIFSMLLGVCMQLSNAYAGAFIYDFGLIDEYKDSFIIKFPAVVVSLGQVSEMMFILLVPFVLKKWGIRKVMIISMIA